MTSLQKWPDFSLKHARSIGAMAGIYWQRHPEHTVFYRVFFYYFERLLMFSCKTRGFCPSCHAKRREEWGEWKILRWRHTDFNIHSQVRKQTKREAERVGKYMIRKVYELDPLLCPSCGGQMKIIAFIEDPKAIDSIIHHLKLSFQAERPPPSHVAHQQLLMAAEESREYFT